MKIIDLGSLNHPFEETHSQYVWRTNKITETHPV